MFFVLLLLLGLVTSCSNEPYFNGEIQIIENFENEIEMSSQSILWEDIYDDYMLVCDTLALFTSAKYPDNWIYVFNTKTGKHIGSLCPKGVGPNDFQYCITFGQFLKKDGGVKLWVNDYISKSCLVNITQSIKENRTICDSVIVMPWIKSFQFPTTAMFFLEDGRILAKNQCEKLFLKSNEYEPRSYKMYLNDLNTVEAEYNHYNKPIVGDYTTLTYATHYSSCDRIKPDQSKIAMAMNRVGQLNIWDLKTGEILGYRIKDSHDFSDLKSSPSLLRFYYLNMCVNEDYIFAPYIDKLSVDNGLDAYQSSCIHVYDWEGRALYKLNLREKVYCISLDDENDILYAKDMDNNLYSYNISFLKK